MAFDHQQLQIHKVAFKLFGFPLLFGLRPKLIHSDAVVFGFSAKSLTMSVDAH